MNHNRSRSRVERLEGEMLGTRDGRIAPAYLRGAGGSLVPLNRPCPPMPDELRFKLQGDARYAALFRVPIVFDTALTGGAGTDGEAFTLWARACLAGGWALPDEPTY